MVVITIEIDKYQKDFLHIYLIELQILTNAIVNDCDKIFNSLKVPDSGYLITVDADNQALINSIIVSTGNIKKLLLPTASKYDKESHQSFETRTKRGKFLREALEISENEYFLDVKVRNSIEHFDERVDKLSLRYKNKYTSLMKTGSILYNMSISSRNVFSPEPYYLKVYIVEEKTAVIDNKELNLGTIYDEINNLVIKLKNILGEDDVGGLLMPLV